jgi:hypothetical protein
MRKMLRSVVFAASFAAALCAAAPRGEAAGPKVTNVIEGRDAETGQISVMVVGSGVSKFKTFTLNQTTGEAVGDAVLTFKSATMISLRLPVGTTTGAYDLVMTAGKVVQTHRITLSAGYVEPGSITSIALAPSLRTDLDDAVTLMGKTPSDFATTSNTVGVSGPGAISGSLTVNGVGVLKSIVGENLAPNGVGVYGHSVGGLQPVTGVEGASDSTAGVGVYGHVDTTAGFTFGVRGYAASTDGVGVGGFSDAGTGSTYGVFGSAASAAGTGVRGLASATSGGATGVSGVSASTTGIGVHGDATATTGGTTGVYGSVASTTGTGVYGYNSSATGFTYGVYGTLPSPDGIATFGNATSTTGSATGVFGRTASAAGFGVFGSASNTSGGGYAMYGTTAGPSGVGVYGVATASAAGSAGYGVIGSTSGASGVGVQAICNGSGVSSVGLLVDHGGAAGSLAIFRSGGTNAARIDKSGKGFFNGGTQTSGADFAESVGVRAAGRPIEAGDVVAIDRGGRRRFVLCTETESALVAGICSTKPGVLACPRDVAGERADAPGEIPLAITGIVPCKTCDEGGPIESGDLLVAASIPGYAKKAPASPKAGTIVAKALEPMSAERGRIEVLITMR